MIAPQSIFTGPEDQGLAKRMPNARQMVAQFFDKFHKSFPAGCGTGQDKATPMAARLDGAHADIFGNCDRFGRLRKSSTSPSVRSPVIPYLPPEKAGQASDKIFDKSSPKPNEE